MKQSGRAFAGLCGLLLVAAAGCSGVQQLSFPTPPTTARANFAAGPTLPTNLSSMSQPGVAGVTTTTALPIGPGQATLNGTVFGPSGPVPGATVEVDRFVGDQTAKTQTTTAADGSWSVGNVLGGRYRVRAWQSPSLDLMTPQIVFLGSTATLAVPMQLTAITGPSISIAMSPPDPQVSQPANLVVQVTNPTVGPDGVVRNPPDVGAPVTLTNGPNWQVYNGNPLSTGSDGTVLFQVTCQASGNDPLSAAVGSAAPTPLAVPVCLAPPPPTTTTLPTPTTCPPSATTTGPPNFSTTTTTLTFGGC